MKTNERKYDERPVGRLFWHDGKLVALVHRVYYNW